MDIFTYDWIGFVITGFATLFLIGEILVNMRGVFALLGIGFITVYFTVFLETESLFLMLLIYFVGIILIIIDGKLLNDGTLATIGLASMLISVAIPASNLTAGVYGVLGVLVGGVASFLFLKVFKRREMWSKITLRDTLSTEAGYNSMSEEYKRLLGQEGIALTDFRPVGTVEINNKTYSAVSNGQWIEKNSRIEVVKVEGTRVLINLVK